NLSSAVAVASVRGDRQQPVAPEWANVPAAVPEGAGGPAVLAGTDDDVGEEVPVRIRKRTAHRQVDDLARQPRSGEEVGGLGAAGTTRKRVMKKLNVSCASST